MSRTQRLEGGLRAVARSLPPGFRRALRSSRPVTWVKDRRERLQLERSLRLRGGIRWKPAPDAPSTLYDAGGAQIGHLLYVVCGYQSIDAASDDIFVFDMRLERWVDTIHTPAYLAHSHCAVASDGERFLYMASGQIGAQCGPATRTAYSYDTVEARWHHLPPVPHERYASVMELWRGRLHFIGGAESDRWTPTASHWSLGVSDGVATETEWREETPIPVAGMHRASAIVGDRLFVLGGQQGDFQAIPGDPNCMCTGATQETYLDCCFRLDDPSAAWRRIADMPVAASHCDFAAVVSGDRIIVLGGQVYKHPEDFYLRLSDAIQSYSVQDNRWEVVGHLPYRLKIPVVGCWDERLFVTTGQRGKGNGDMPAEITASTWTASLPAAPARNLASPSAWDGLDVLMISHDLTRTGSPLLLMETARAMLDRGALVRVASAADDVEGWNLCAEFLIPRIPIEMAIEASRRADVVVANTSAESTKKWVGDCLHAEPSTADKLLWWIHEIDVEDYQSGMDPLRDAAMALFDSEAAQSAWRDAVRLPSATGFIHPPLTDAFVELAGQPKLHFSEDRRRPRSQTNPLLSREEMRLRLGVSSDDFLVCNIGTFMPHKGQRLLIETVAEAARERGLPLKLLLVGLKDAAQRDGVLKRLTPDERRVLSPARTYVSQSDCAAFYRASDAFVMNSQGGVSGRGECFGRVTVEAMAFGLPVLGTDAGGTSEIVRDGETGLLFPVGGSGQKVLADHLQKLVREPDVAKAMGASGRQRALHDFRQDAFLDQLHRAFALTKDRAA